VSALIADGIQPQNPQSLPIQKTIEIFYNCDNFSLIMQIYQQGQLGKEDCPRFTNYPPVPSPSMGEGKGGGKEVRIACLSGRQGTVPEVETKSLGKIMSPLDTLELGKGGDE